MNDHRKEAIMRHHHLRHFVRFVICISFIVQCYEAIAQGQRNQSQSGRPTSAGNRRVSVTESFEPAFSIEPLAHSITGNSGDVIPFEFKIESTNGASNIEVIPIGLRQELTGQILHDQQAQQAEMLRLSTPTNMTLPANTPTLIQGVVRIPSGQAKHYSAGIMVREQGRGDEVQPQFNPDGTPRTQAAIRFVTQYVLRLDITAEGTRGESGHELEMVDARLVPFEGRPKFQTIVQNTTDTTFEFELRAQLRSSPSDRSFKQLRLVMPIRAQIEDEKRFIGRILPKSQVRMEELLPEAIASGEYEVELELLMEGRVVEKKVFPLSVDATDYPAQEVLIAQVGSDLIASPAQIELSTQRGGTRRLTLLLQNKGKSSKSIHLSALGENQLPLGTRKVALTLRGTNDAADVTYGNLLIDCETDGRDFHETRELPLAVITKSLDAPKLAMTPLTWDPNGAYPAFRTTLTNDGAVHVPLQARLAIADETGTTISILGGFGKWLLPTKKTTLEFRMDKLLLPGQYQLRCEVLQGDGPSLVNQQTFEVTDLDNAQ
jgi:hypothetical protein